MLRHPDQTGRIRQKSHIYEIWSSLEFRIISNCLQKQIHCDCNQKPFPYPFCSHKKSPRSFNSGGPSYVRLESEFLCPEPLSVAIYMNSNRT